MSLRSKAAVGGRVSLLRAASAVLGLAVAAVGATVAPTAALGSTTTAWDQPALVSPVTITISDTNRTLMLSPFQDYILRCPTGVDDVNGKIAVTGGHNVVFQSCDE